MKRVMAALIATLLLTAIPVGAAEAPVLRTAATAVAQLVARVAERRSVEKSKPPPPHHI